MFLPLPQPEPGIRTIDSRRIFLDQYSPADAIELDVESQDPPLYQLEGPFVAYKTIKAECRAQKPARRLRHRRYRVRPRARLRAERAGQKA